MLLEGQALAVSIAAISWRSILGAKVKVLTVVAWVDPPISTTISVNWEVNINYIISTRNLYTFNKKYIQQYPESRCLFFTHSQVPVV